MKKKKKEKSHKKGRNVKMGTDLEPFSYKLRKSKDYFLQPQEAKRRQGDTPSLKPKCQAQEKRFRFKSLHFW